MTLVANIINDLVEELPVIGVAAEAAEAVAFFGIILGGDAFNNAAEYLGVDHAVDVLAELGIADQDWEAMQLEATASGGLGEYVHAIMYATGFASAAIADESGLDVQDGDVRQALAHYSSEGVAELFGTVAEFADMADGPDDSVSNELRELAAMLGGDGPASGSAHSSGAGSPSRTAVDPSDEDGDGEPDKVYTARSEAWGHMLDVLWLDSRMMLVPRREVIERLHEHFSAKFAPYFATPGGIFDSVEGPAAEEVAEHVRDAFIEVLTQVEARQLPEVLVACAALWGATGDQGQRALMRYVPYGLAPQHPRRGDSQAWHENAERIKAYDDAKEAFVDWLEGKGTDRKGLPHRSKSQGYKAACMALSMIGTPSHALRDPRWLDN